MGSGSWDRTSFATYSMSKGMDVDSATGVISGDYSSTQMYTQKHLHAELNPYNIVRECVDSVEHPRTRPVILALDVTGSMGQTAVEVSKQLNAIMTHLYGQVKDIEFCVMGIGDLAYDRKAPIQMSQFESDVRIAEHMDKVYFEYGGGGNSYESYTAAWYMGARHTKLDCWKRGGKGIIITLGDERLNPYLPKRALSEVTGDSLQGDVETQDLYTEVTAKFDVYHIDVKHRDWHDDGIDPSWKAYLDADHYKSVPLNSVKDTIVDMILNAVGNTPAPETQEVEGGTPVSLNNNGEIVW